MQGYPRDSSSMEDLAELAMMINRRGLARMHSDNFDSTYTEFLSALKLCQWLHANQNCPIEKVAGVVANLGNLQVLQERFSDSLVLFRESLKLMDGAGENKEQNKAP